MLAVAAPTFAGDGLPAAQLSWKRGLGSLQVTAPPGEHIDPASPVRVAMDQAGRHQELAAHGDLLVEGWSLPVVEGELSGELRLSLCEDGGSICRVVDVTVDGAVAGRKGTATLRVEPATAPTPPEPIDEGPGFAADPDAAFADALARAAATDRAVLVDFSAIWCPPCNMLAAEVLDDPADADALAGLELVKIDVDRTDSWTLKDRYAVGGYPTVVVANAAGEELGRQVGYADEAAFLDWLGGVVDPAPVDPLVQADRLARAGRTDAARGLLAQVTPQPDALAYRRVALMVAENPDPADLRWLLDHEDSRQRVLEWIWDLRGLAASDPDLAAATRAFLLDQTVGGTAMEASDLLYVVAGLTDDEDAARAIYGASAAVLAGGLRGDPSLDKGLYSSLADLYENAAMTGPALDVLRDAVAAFPDEMTFHYALAGALVDADQADAAVAEAQVALDLSYGDNRLRSARRLAEALSAADRTDDALAVIDAALAEAASPAEGVDVRTPRYLDALRKLRAELAGE